MTLISIFFGQEKHMSRFFTFVKRTVVGADGTTYHRSGLTGFLVDALEAAAGFFGIVASACLFTLIGHWLDFW